MVLPAPDGPTMAVSPSAGMRAEKPATMGRPPSPSTPTFRYSNRSPMGPSFSSGTSRPADNLGPIMPEEISVTLPDGSVRSLPAGATAGDLAASIGRGLAKAAVAATVDGRQADLTTPLADGATVAIITSNTDEGRYVLRHSTAHVMAQAVTDLWPGAKYAIGPAIEDGFYYDFDLPGGAHFTATTSSRIEARMREIIAEDQPFVREELPEGRGVARFATSRSSSRSSRASTRRVAPRARGQASTYKNADGSSSTCAGARTSDTPGAIWARSSSCGSAGAYWRGDERNRDQLQRIYGTAWESAKALDEHLQRLEEAEKPRPPQARHRARPVPLPARDRWRSAGLPSQGRPHPQADGGLLPGGARGGRLRVRLHPHLAKSTLFETSRATSAGTRTACTPRWRWRGPPTTPSP